ncbi:hypothetical protein EM868_05750 [Cupriavidus gilardii]|uniref:beta-ketoacyl synthase chain length factor n=1 Tax=Cupriavidus gilardii TaxID=82541 RepID=UPI001571F434|nr:beta-ketoacyl synthase chain length factor [Cupriavidus gilardii]MCG5258782.1 beta-ketoacyl synthase chain length factor [Cupriavidus gilardii]MDF9429300.1 hypothetical protein [Cupriavidus gilardii]NSX04381.1 beta-ketoacyl synthase chain length factor [Cupriavidus gilardii]
MACEFAIRGWAACAPQLHTAHDWEAWSRAPWLPLEGEVPPVAGMAPMLRRRLGALGRVALHAAYACDAPADIPMVFASRHGEVSRSALMLEELAGDAPLSPTSFGLSVHNAIGALYSIDQRRPAVLQAIAAGSETAEAALVEACGLLADGHEEVLVVCYDAPLPLSHAMHADEPDALYAWAWRIAAPCADAPRWTLACGVEDRTGGVDAVAIESPCDAGEPLPHGLAVLRFMLAGSAALRHRGGGRSWIWRRHG